MSTVTDNRSCEKEYHPETCKETFFPAVHSYATIKLDPVGSVSFLEDDESATAAKDMAVETYVGFLAGNHGPLWIGTPPYETFQVRMLRPDPPASISENFITSDMCIPVFPNTQLSSREPIKPVPNIPWSNAYHAAFETVDLRVRSAFADPAPATVLPTPERKRLFKACLEDSRRRVNSMHEFTKASGDALASSASGCSEDGNETEVEAAYDDQPERDLLAHMSYDLTSVKELSDPQGLLREIEAVKKIIQCARERKAEKTKQAIEKAREIDDEAYNHRSPVVPVPLEKPVAVIGVELGPPTDSCHNIELPVTGATPPGYWTSLFGRMVRLATCGICGQAPPVNHTQKSRI